MYERAMEMAAVTHIYLTRIHANFDCDTFFPEIDFKNYIEVSPGCWLLTFISALDNVQA